MKNINNKTREKRISNFIRSIKYLYNKKYYKINKVSCAAWDSWAAQGKAGGCRICNNNFYNKTLHNKRASTRKNGYKSDWVFNHFGHLCDECYDELEKQLDYEFIKY